MNETDLIISIRNGDSDAFAKLYDLYKNNAVRTAYLITGNRASAEDVAQEAFVKCYLEIGRLQNPECFRTWFYRLLVRTAWRHAEVEKRNVPVEDVFEESKPSGDSFFYNKGNIVLRYNNISVCFKESTLICCT